MLSYGALKEDIKRDLLRKLRGVLEEHALAVPNRYVKLVEELLDQIQESVQRIRLCFSLGG